MTYDQVVAAGEPDFKTGRGHHIRLRYSSAGVESLLDAYEETGAFENLDGTHGEFYAEGRPVRETSFSTDQLLDFEDGKRESILGGMDRKSDAEAVANQVK